LNSHAAAVHLYRTKFQANQKGEIGIALNHDFAVPLTSSPEDIAAAERKNQFTMGWFADPIVFGKYPQVMRDIVGDRLPEFTAEESSLLRGSFDFWALNHYTTHYASQGGVYSGNT
jgi:beta-glucosidase/6-phospho-beta-glucosidase/beta-galactosidase